MDKRVIFAAALSVLILLAWGFLFPPPEPPLEPTPVAPGDALVDTWETAPETMPEPEPTEISGELPAEEAIQAERVEETRFENDLYQVAFSNRGARVLSWKLRNYTTKDGSPLELLPQFRDEASLTLAFELDDPGLATTLNDALYRVEREHLPGGQGVPPGDRIRFEWSDGRGLTAVKTLTFRDGYPLIDVAADITDRGRSLPTRLIVGPGFGAQEPGNEGSRYSYPGQGAWNQGGKVTRLKPRKITKEPGRFAANLRWVGLEDQYFTALFLPGDGLTDVSWRSVEWMPAAPVGDEEQAEIAKQPILAVSIPAEGAKFFVGPKKYSLLKDLGYDLESSVWFATNPFLAWIAKSIFIGLLWIYDHTIPNYGLAIVLSTFLLRVLLFPVNQYSMVSMKKTQLQMQRLQPKIKAIKSRYKKLKDAESRQKMNQETMELYKREGVNPMGGLNGCLPLLAQFPILIGFYNMLTVAVELRGAPFFGWITDLSMKDPYWITPLLMGATMFLQQRLAMSKVKDPVQQQQQKFMMFMPFMFTWICLQMPAGLVLYWFVNNVLGIGQQWLVNRHTSRLEAATQKG